MRERYARLCRYLECNEALLSFRLVPGVLPEMPRLGLYGRPLGGGST